MSYPAPPPRVQAFGNLTTIEALMRLMLVFLFLTACGGLAWDTEVADTWQVRQAMLESVQPGQTTEGTFRARWGVPTQKIREGGQATYVYRSMKDEKKYRLPKFGDSTRFVAVVFQYGMAVDAYSSETQGCRATFPPRPPGPGFDNPSTVKPVNCGVGNGSSRTNGQTPGVTNDAYDPDTGYK